MVEKFSQLLDEREGRSVRDVGRACQDAFCSGQEEGLDETESVVTGASATAGWRTGCGLTAGQQYEPGPKLEPSDLLDPQLTVL
jgi:hypothetical protein